MKSLSRSLGTVPYGSGQVLVTCPGSKRLSEKRERIFTKVNSMQWAAALPRSIERRSHSVLWANLCTAPMRSKQMAGYHCYSSTGLRKPGAADATLKRCAGAYWRKASSTSMPEAPSVCMWQRLGAGGRKKCRRLGTIQEMEGAKNSEWMTTKYERYKAQYILRRSPVSSNPEHISHTPAGPGPRVQPGSSAYALNPS